MDKHYILGDYVFTGIKNAFNNHTSFWMSKNGYTTAVYCFSADTQKEVDYQLQADIRKGYIALLESKLSDFVVEGHDTYKVEELQKMYDYEINPDHDHYGANLRHYAPGMKPLTIDAGGLKALMEYYKFHKTNLA